MPMIGLDQDASQPARLTPHAMHHTICTNSLIQPIREPPPHLFKVLADAHYGSPRARAVGSLQKAVHRQTGDHGAKCKRLFVAAASHSALVIEASMFQPHALHQHSVSRDMQIVQPCRERELAHRFQKGGCFWSSVHSSYEARTGAASLPLAGAVSFTLSTCLVLSACVHVGVL